MPFIAELHTHVSIVTHCTGAGAGGGGGGGGGGQVRQLPDQFFLLLVKLNTKRY